jgi:ribosomal protein L11 methyltransferase
VYVGEKIMIRADFHEADKNVVHDIIITPQMSFGTGHHETTTMMIEAMCEVDCNGKTVLDFGTGTGILAIFAEKLGAEAVLAIDYDSWSISNANENISKNCCKRISLVQADRVPEGAKFDLVLSNINKNIILDSRRKFSGVLEENGVLIVSGFLDIDLEEVCSLFGSHFGKPHLILKKNNWVCLTFILERIEH